jgi:hypothetical protein
VTYRGVWDWMVGFTDFNYPHEISTFFGCIAICKTHPYVDDVGLNSKTYRNNKMLQLLSSPRPTSNMLEYLPYFECLMAKFSSERKVKWASDSVCTGRCLTMAHLIISMPGASGWMENINLFIVLNMTRYLILSFLKIYACVAIARFITCHTDTAISSPEN